jgi:hypothetical protein
VECDITEITVEFLTEDCYFHVRNTLSLVPFSGEHADLYLVGWTQRKWAGSWLEHTARNKYSSDTRE